MDTSHKDRYKADLLTIKKSFYQDYWDGYGLSEEQMQWMINTIDAQAKEIEALGEIAKAVAHIGIDFGYGRYELEDKHIEAARKYLKLTA